MMASDSMSFFEGRPYNVLATALAVVGGLGGLLGAYYGRRALFPIRRRLEFAVAIPASLIERPQKQLGDISVLLNGVPVPDPHVTTVVVESSGSHDIATEQFDNGRPIVLDFQAEIVSLMRLDSISRTPKWSVDKTRLFIGPDLIRTNQRMIFQVLTARAPAPHQIESYLADTDVKLSFARPLPPAKPPRQDRKRTGVHPTLAIILLVLIVLAILSCCVAPLFSNFTDS